VVYILGSVDKCYLVCRYICQIFIQNGPIVLPVTMVTKLWDNKFVLYLYVLLAMHLDSSV